MSWEGRSLQEGPSEVAAVLQRSLSNARWLQKEAVSLRDGRLGAALSVRVRD